jgi:hypothetical protein
LRIRADVALGGQPGRGAAEVENGRREWVEEQEKLAAGCSVRNTNRNTVCISCAKAAREAPLRHGPCSHKIDAQLRYIRRSVRGGLWGVRGWTWECIPSCSVVAGPAVPHPAFNRHPVPFICWSTRDAISWPHVTNAETTSHGHPRRVKCRGGDVNRRLQNEPSFGVNHRKVNRIRFRRRSCRPRGCLMFCCRFRLIIM